MWKIGEEVRFLNDTGSGEIVDIQGEEALIMKDDGFDYWLPFSELIPHKNLQVERVEQKDNWLRPKANPKSHVPDRLEKDLHFTQLVAFPKNYDNFQMLQIQLAQARKTIDKARKAGIKRVILIHGIGQGVLREQLHQMLERMDRLQFFDADFARYGRGATEIELF